MEHIPLSPQAKHWMAHLDTSYHTDLSLIEKACAFASHHDSDATPFSLSTLTQGLTMAESLTALHCDSETVSAAIIYPAVFYNPALHESLSAYFDKPICKIIAGALQMETIHQLQVKKNRVTGQQNQIDNLRKMMLAMVDDIRTVLVKLAERLVMLQHLNRSTPDAQQKIAQESMDYYAPLANRLGIHHLKWQLEDWSFRYVNPTEYQRISKALHRRHQDRVRLIHEMIGELKTLLEKGELHHAKISGRIKHIYSIYRKIQRKQVSIEQIYDTSAIRLLVPSIADCYTALSLVHATWEPVTNEFDDYIAKPKQNGYRSIHTAITRPDHTHVEIQIRTLDMHEKAELGVAAHWRYKENKTVSESEDEKISLLRDLLDWQKSIDKKESHSEIYQAAFKDRVYVFSPAGDVYDLRHGATPLDFAYLLHSEIGHRCRGAKVNGTLVPLTYLLKTGDRIEILTAKKSQPSHDWIRPDFGYLTTIHAIRKVKQWFKKQHHEQNLSDGATLWEKSAQQHHLKDIDLQALASACHLLTKEALFIALGAGDLTLTAVINKASMMIKSESTDEPLRVIETGAVEQTALTADFSVQGATHLLTQVAHCCHPIPGDSIIGYITKGRGITVHQKSCRNIKALISAKPERSIPISWQENQENSYRVSVEIEGEDRAGLLRDISGLLTQLNLSIHVLQSRVNTQNAIAFIQLTIVVKDLQALECVIKKIRQIRGVMRVMRKERG